MAHDSLAVANKIIEIANEKKLDITPMKLLKLVYLAHGWTLGLTGEPLIDEPVEAWKYGPVIPSVYHKFKKFGDKPITKKSTNWVGIKDHSDFDSVEEEIIQKVVEEYGGLTAIQLSSLTHQKGTPWSISWDVLDGKFQSGFPISNRLIKEHYEQKANF